MKFSELLIWAGLVAADAWLFNLQIENRYKGYGSALLLAFGFFINQWGLQLRSFLPVAAVVGGCAAYEGVVRRAARLAPIEESAAGEDTAPTRDAWDRLSTHFRKYDGEIEATWTLHPDVNRTTWWLERRRDNARRLQEFIVDAKRAGLLAKAMGPRRTTLPVSAESSPEDYWLTIVQTEVDPMSDVTIEGYSREQGTRKSGVVKDVVHASAIACKKLSMEIAEAEQRAVARA